MTNQLFTRIIISLALLAGFSLSASAAAPKTAEETAQTISNIIISIAEDNELAITAETEIAPPVMTIKALMTDEEDSIDYIAGFLTRDNALNLLAPFIAPTLKTRPEIKEVKASITDAAGQAIILNYTSEEIIESAGPKR